MKFASPLGIILGLVTAGLAAQKNLKEVSLAVDPTGQYSFCRLFYSRSAVVGTKLYIDGGSLSLGLNVTNPTMDFTENNNRLLTVDLSTTFTLGDHSVASREKPSSEPTLNDGIMFSSGDDLVTYGGFYPGWNTSASGTRQPSSSVSATRSFDISGGQWSAVNGLPGLAAGAGVSVPGGKTWYLGGVQDDRTTEGLKGRFAVKGMLEFTGTSVKNLTAPSDGLMGAMMAHIPALGKEGILVRIGGERYTAGVVDSTHIMASMESVDIYDISSGAWYTQNTTGDPTAAGGSANGFPKPRMIGCVVAASAPDNSSYHIYMLSGAGKYFGDSFDDVWVLSLPMFRWTKVSENQFGFFGHTCHLVGNNRYMLSLGGYREADWCESFVYVYDVSGLGWVDTYYPNTAYFVPQKIVNFIGGTSQGGATVKSPEAGWGSNVEALFQSQNTSQPPSPSNSTSPSPSPSPESKSNTTAILGGVLGGLLGVAAGLSALLFLLRRRRRRQDASQLPKPEALPTTDLETDPAQLYDGRAAWSPPPQEMYADLSPVEAGGRGGGTQR